MIQIESVQRADWPAALQLALAHVPADQRPDRVAQSLRLLEAGILHPGGIWIARAQGVVVAAQVCVPLGGSACLFWLPTGTGETSTALVQAALQWARSLGCKIGQTLVHSNEMPWTGPLTRNGFRSITRLHHWGRHLGGLPAPPSAPLRFECYRSTRAAEFAVTLERTYESTLDCPELNGVRSKDEIVEGHRTQGKFNADFWWLAFDGAQPVGVVMLVETPDGITWELAYLGLVPEYRRRGLARILLLHALHALRNQPATQVILAVDERNLPAQRLYQGLGFVEMESTEALLYFF